MPFNGNGQFNRLYSWQQDAANGIDIDATRMDDDTDDITDNGLSLCITRDGQGGPTANIDWNGFRITNAQDAVDPQDYATLAQVSAAAGVNYVFRTANYTVTSADAIIDCDASGGDFTITYPVALLGVRPISVSKVDHTAGIISISDGTSVIGVLTFPPIGQNFQSYEMYSNGSSVRLI